MKIALTIHYKHSKVLIKDVDQPFAQSVVERWKELLTSGTKNKSVFWHGNNTFIINNTDVLAITYDDKTKSEGRIGFN